MNQERDPNMSMPDEYHPPFQDMLRLFRCDWPNGDVSFVLAENENEAIFELDEVGAAEEAMLTEVVTFQLHLALKRKKRRAADPKDEPPWRFVLEGFGDTTAEYMDPAAAADRKKMSETRRQRGDTPDPAPQTELAPQDRPLRALGDIELRKVFDEQERGPDSPLRQMLQDARSGETGLLRTAAVVLVLRDGEERPLAAFSEYGDGEGRESAASCLRHCDQLGALTAGERLERMLVETRLPSLASTRATDPVAEDSGYSWLKLRREATAAGAHDVVDANAEEWRRRIAQARNRPAPLLVSVGMLTLPDGTARPFCESGETGDNSGRRMVADNIRTSRRLRLLRDGESAERHMLEIRLQPLRAVLKTDPLRVPGKTLQTTRSARRPGP